MALVDIDFLQSRTEFSGRTLSTLSYLEIGRRDYVLAESYDGGLHVFELGNGGRLTARGAQFDDPYAPSPAISIGKINSAIYGEFVPYQSGGSKHVFYAGVVNVGVTNGERSLNVFDVARGAQMTHSFEYAELENFGSALDTARLGGRDYLVQLGGYGDRLAVYRIGADASLTETDRVENNGRFGSGTPAFDVATFGKTAYALAGYTVESAVSVTRIDANGQIGRTVGLERDDPALGNRIVQDIEVAQVGRKNFVMVADNTRGTIVSYELKKSGALELRDIEAQDGDDAWGFARTLEAFEVRGQDYLAVGGSSLGIFAITASGALIEVDEHSPPGFGGHRIAGLTGIDRGGDQFLVASTAATDGLRSFRFRPDGNDLQNGNGGNNRLKGAEDDDWIAGGGGRDRLYGFDKDDVLEGGRGADRAWGGDGEDVLDGGAARDLLFGEAGGDFLNGDGGSDLMYGGDGVDQLTGDAGRDRLVGGGAGDRIYGGAGGDRIYGDDDPRQKVVVRPGLQESPTRRADTYGDFGGADLISDGRGADVMYGGVGADTFLLTRDRATDRIMDWAAGDLIDLTDWGPRLEFADLRLRQNGSDTVWLQIGNEKLVLQADGADLDAGLFGTSDFIFA